MGSPTIFSGSNTKFLTAGSFLSSGQPLNYNGEINWIANSNAVQATTGWATYANAAQATPVDGTGGSPTVTWTRTTSSPIRGAADFLFTKDAADRQGQGASYDFSIDSADTNKLCKISFDTLCAGSYVAGDLAVYVYDITNATLITPSSTSVPAITVNGAPLEVTFVTTTSTSYRLIFHVATTNASAYTVRFNNVLAGPGRTTSGASIGPWETWTPTGSWTTNTTYTGRKRRVGQNLEAIVQIALSGAPTAATLTIDLPSSLTIDETAIPKPTGGDSFLRMAPFGDGTARDEGVRAVSLGVGYSDSTKVVVYSKVETVGTVDYGNVNATSPFTFADTDDIGIKFTVPIAEWAGGGFIGQNNVEYVYNTNTATLLGAGDSDTTSFGYGPSGVLVGAFNSTTVNTFTTRRVRFSTPIQPTDDISIELKGADGGWIKSGQSGATTGYLAQGTSLYGVRVIAVSGSTTDVDVQFGNKGRVANNATYAGNGADWSGLSSDTYWRVKKVSAGSPVGFGIANATQSGLVSTTTQTFAGTKTFTGGINLGQQDVSTLWSGTWTPVYDSTGAANIAATGASASHFMQLNGVVFFTARLGIQTTSNNSATLARFSLPVISNFTTGSDLQATVTALNTTANITFQGIAEAVASDTKMQIRFRGDTTTANTTYVVSGSYRIR